MANHGRKQEYWDEIEDSEPFHEGHDNAVLWEYLEKLQQESKMTTMDILRVGVLIREAFRIGALSQTAG